MHHARVILGHAHFRYRVYVVAEFRLLAVSNEEFTDLELAGEDLDHGVGASLATRIMGSSPLSLAMRYQRWR